MSKCHLNAVVLSQ